MASVCHRSVGNGQGEGKLIAVYIVLAVLCPLLCFVSSYLGARYVVMKFVDVVEEVFVDEEEAGDIDEK